MDSVGDDWQGELLFSRAENFVKPRFYVCILRQLSNMIVWEHTEI